MCLILYQAHTNNNNPHNQVRDAIRQAAVRRQRAAANVRAEVFDAVRTRGGYVDACKEAEDVWVAWGGGPGYTDGWAPVWWREGPPSEHPSDSEEPAETASHQDAAHGSTCSGRKPFCVQSTCRDVDCDAAVVKEGAAVCGTRARVQADAERIIAILLAGRSTAMVRFDAVPFIFEGLAHRPPQRRSLAADPMTELRNMCHELNQKHILPNFDSFDMDSLPPAVADMCMALLMGPVRAYIPDYDPFKEAVL